MKEILKNTLLIVCFGIIMWLAVTFIISAGIIVFILIIFGLAICGAYKLWEQYAKEELLKKEENFDTLKENNKNEKEDN